MRKTKKHKRKDGERYPSGRLKPQKATAECAILDETLARRADLVGTGNERRPEAGHALGILLLRGQINRRQHDAGRRFETAWKRWASLAGLPHHHAHVPGNGGGRGADPDDMTWERAKELYGQLCGVLAKCSPRELVWRVVENVVMDQVLPPAFLAGERAGAMKALHDGLDGIANFLKLPAAERYGDEKIVEPPEPASEGAAA